VSNRVFLAVLREKNLDFISENTFHFCEINKLGIKQKKSDDTSK